MGPTLALLLRRALDAAGGAAARRTVFAVSRFSDAAARQTLESGGVHTVEADLLEASSYARLPAAANVYFLAGMKFGASTQVDLTWAMNTHVPALVAQHYRASRLVVFSTGNVYPFVPAASGGADEETPPAPVGEYAMSCLGRERIVQHFSRLHATAAVIVRLSYANEPRYGVIVDLTRTILAGEPVDLGMGWVNLIWQGDANDLIARSVTLAASPPCVLNVTGAQALSVRDLAQRIGELTGRPVRFSGSEGPVALLADTGRCRELLGSPRCSVEEMLAPITAWVAGGGRTLGKPTKFQVRDGRF
jgi:nucleoside-diphosphate-sugar epimerase